MKQIKQMTVEDLKEWCCSRPLVDFQHMSLKMTQESYDKIFDMCNPQERQFMLRNLHDGYIVIYPDHKI